MSDPQRPSGERPVERVGGAASAPTVSAAQTNAPTIVAPPITAAQARASGAPGGAGTRAVAAPPARPKPMGAFQLLVLVAAMVGVAYAIVSWTQVAPALVEVIYLSGEAYTGERPLALGDLLPPQAPVRLEADARCFLQLPSGLVLRLSNEAAVSFGATNQPLALSAGRLDVELAAGMDELIGPPLHLQLPDGTALVAQSSRYTLHVGAGRSTLAVFEGEVEVKAGDKLLRIGKNEGSLIEPGKAPRRVALPPAPKIALPARDAKLETIAPAVACEPVEGAVRYEWEARIEGDPRVAMVEATLDHAAGTLPRLPADGRYRLRARAVSPEGLAGPQSDPIVVSLVLYASIESKYTLAHNYQINGYHKEALEQVQKGLALWPDSPRLLRVRALALAATKDVGGAIDIAKRLAVSAEPQAKDALVELIGELRKTHPSDPRVAALVVPTGRKR